MRSFRECISHLEILMGRIPERNGIRLLILTWWEGISIYGWTASRSCGRGNSCWKVEVGAEFLRSHAFLFRPTGAKLMIPALRQRFNVNFTPEKYQLFMKLMEERCETP